MKLLHALVISAATGATLAAGGFGLGVQGSYGLGHGQAIVPRLDYLHETDSNDSVDAKADVVCLGADYDYFTSGRTGQGLYVLGGLGLATGNIKVTAAIPGFYGSATSNQLVGYYEVGAGYQFTRHLGAELLYKGLNFRDVTVNAGGYPVAYSLTGGVQLALTLRF